MIDAGNHGVDINEDKIGKIGEDINLTNVDEIYGGEYIKSGKNPGKFDYIS